MQKAIDDINLPRLDEAQVKNIIGLGLPEAVRQLFPKAEVADLERLRESYVKHFISADREPCEFYPGVESVLHSLRNDGHWLTVATGKSRHGLNRVLSNVGLENFFDATRCADETASKPNPLMVNQIMSQFDVNESSTIMVGDTEYDLEMATNAGIPSIGVSYGAHSKDRLIAHNPVRIIDSFSQLLDRCE